jgi:hypothetical protein
MTKWMRAVAIFMMCPLTIGGLQLGLWAAINRGTIRGTVKDPQGAVIPKAAVTVTNISTNISQTTQSNDSGFYLVAELVPGAYKVRLEVPGFVPMEITNVLVKANDVSTVDAELELGQESQHVEVTATNPLVETTASNFSVPLERTYIEELPILGRDIQSLVQLIPGAVQSLGPPGSLVGFNSAYSGFPDPTHYSGSLIAINGSQAGANVWYLDGNMNAAQGIDNVVVNPVPDAVSEFQAVSNGFAAEYGRSAGAVFNVVLKSGTNNWHGSLYEYNRNSLFHARNPFAQLNAKGEEDFHRFVNWNQFGGTIGGPVTLPGLYDGRKRTFFFTSWDLSFLHQKSPRLYTVPTLKMRNNDLSEDPNVRQFGLYDPLTTKYNPNTFFFERQPFLNPDGSRATGVPADRLDRVALFYLNEYPFPNYLDPLQQDFSKGGCLNLCNNYRGDVGSSQTTHNVSIKVDHQFSDKNKLFVEWLYNPTYYANYKLPWAGATAPVSGANGSSPYRLRNQIAAIGHTYSFSPTLLNEARFSFSRQALVPYEIADSLVNNSGVLEQLKGLNIPTAAPFAPVPIISIGGGYGFGPPSFNNAYQMEEAFTVLDNVTKVYGKHTLKSGFMFRRDRDAYVYKEPTFIGFSGGLTNNPATYQGGAGLAQFLLGAVDPYSGTYVVNNPYISNDSWGFYVQDDFRVNSKLTLNVGLRYDIYGWMRDRYDNLANVDFDQPNPEIPTRKGRLVYIGTKDHPDRRLFPANKGSFAPRLNFAYSPNQKTVIRGGMNLIYSNGLAQVFGQSFGPFNTTGFTYFTGWTQDGTGQGLDLLGVTPPFILSQGAPPFPISTRAENGQLLDNYINAFAKNEHDPSTTIWNLQIQRELPGNFMLSVGYVGSKGTHLVSDPYRNVNYVPTAARQQLRLKVNELVPTPADLVSLLGPQTTRSRTLLPYPHYSPYLALFAAVDGSSSYQGFHLKAEKRFSHGLSLLLAYAAQKTIVSPNVGGYFANAVYPNSPNSYGRGRIGQLAGLGGFGGFGSNGYQDPDNRRLDRALSPDDVPQVLNAAWTYELPFGPGKAFGGGATGASTWLASGWKISGNFNIQRGIPLSIVGPCNRIGCRPNLIGDPSAGQNSKTRIELQEQWFNPNAFEPVFGSDPNIISALTTGTLLDGTPADYNKIDELWRLGTSGVRLGNARSPGFWNIDLSLAKDVNISERKYLQFRVEIYNAFNHQNLALPNTNWCLPPNPNGSTDVVHQFGCQFGRITNVATDPRNLQFGIKFGF